MDAADYMEMACNDWSLGYSQANRTDVRDGGETDCSALVSWCNFMAGNTDSNPWFSTRTEYDFLTSQGFTVLDPEYDVPERGDTLLTTGHTAIYLGGGTIGEAAHDEYGDIAGGEPGDQTGDETRVSYYYPSNWECILRPPAKGEDEPAPHVETPQEKEARQMQPVSNEGGDVFRLYNPYSGAHHFTISAGERDGLTATGWQSEGVAWTARVGRYAIYRLYNEGNGDHLFTTSFDEAKACADSGWMYEGVPFFASDDGDEVYRLYNPNSGLHMFTTSAGERDALVSAGWQFEGVAFKA